MFCSLEIYVNESNIGKINFELDFKYEVNVLDFLGGAQKRY